jgi:hypothetical protein
MFRLKNRSTNDWLLRFQDGSTYPIWTNNKSEALVFPEDKREFWEDDEDYQIVELSEAEIMAQLPPEIAPRLPGFEW